MEEKSRKKRATRKRQGQKTKKPQAEGRNGKTGRALPNMTRAAAQSQTSVRKDKPTRVQTHAGKNHKNHRKLSTKPNTNLSTQSK